MEYITVRIKNEIKIIFEEEFILQDARATVHRIEQVLILLGIEDYEIKINKYDE